MAVQENNIDFQGESNIMAGNLMLRTKLLVLLLVPMIFILGGVSIYSYYGARNLSNDQIRQTALYIVNSNSVKRSFSIYDS